MRESLRRGARAPTVEGRGRRRFPLCFGINAVTSCPYACDQAEPNVRRGWHDVDGLWQRREGVQEGEAPTLTLPRTRGRELVLRAMRFIHAWLAGRG